MVCVQERGVLPVGRRHGGGVAAERGRLRALGAHRRARRGAAGRVAPARQAGPRARAARRGARAAARGARRGPRRRAARRARRAARQALVSPELFTDYISCFGSRVRPGALTPRGRT